MTPAPEGRRQWIAGPDHPIRQLAKAWLSTPEIPALVAATGDGEPSSLRDLDPLLAWSYRNLDTRGGAERRESPPVSTPLSLQGPILKAARALGLLATDEPSATTYDVIAILGGATTGNALRSELAARVARRVGGWQLVGLASERVLSNAEHLSDPDSVEDHFEWTNLLRQIGRYFGPLTPADGGRDERRFTSSDGREVRILIAASGDGGRRPNTVDQLEFFCERVDPAHRQSVLLVTNAIYAPYQFFSAAPVLLTTGSTRVELIGTETAIDNVSSRTYQRLAQEIHSGIVSASPLADEP